MGFCFNLTNTDYHDTEGIYHSFASQVLSVIYQEDERWRLNRESWVKWCGAVKLAERRDTALGLWDEHNHAVRSELWTAFEEAVIKTKIREMMGEEIRSVFENKIEGIKLNE